LIALACAVAVGGSSAAETSQRGDTMSAKDLSFIR
jgi:hypothetical protein